jgi:signal transduction histidine kinase
MISMQKTEKFRIFKHLIIAGIFFLIIQLTNGYIRWYQKPEQLFSDFKNDFAKLEGDLKLSASTLSQFIDTAKGTTSGNLPNLKSRLLNDPGISLFVFHCDSLKWWNSNQEIFPKQFPDSIPPNQLRVFQSPNGWYAFYLLKTGTWYCVASSLIKNEYSVRNDYLKNYFNPRFNLPENVQLSKAKTDHPVFSDQGKYLFGASFRITSREQLKLSYFPQFRKKLIEIWLLVCFLGGAFYLILFLKNIYEKPWKQKTLQRFVPVFLIGDILLLRAIQFYFKFPDSLYQSELFSPAWYSYSFLLPSPGDFLINALLMLAISYLAGKFFSPKNNQNLPPGWRMLLYFVVLMVLFIIFILTEYLITNLIINSSFPLNFQNIAELIPASFYGLLIVTVLLAALLNFSGILLSRLWWLSGKIIWLLPGMVGCILGYVLFCKVAGNNLNLAIILLFCIYLGYFWKSASAGRNTHSWQNMMFLVFFLALFATIILNKANMIKESDKIDLLALELMSKHNPVTEDRYDAIADEIKEDKRLMDMVHSVAMEPEVTDSLASYLKMTYFNDYWRRYNIQVTVCTPNNQLRVQPQGYLIGCNIFFKNLVKDFGEPTGISGLHYLDYGYGKEFYLAQLDFNGCREAIDTSVNVFLEFSLNGTLPDPGYPGLLLDQARAEPLEIKDYAYAIYRQGRMVQAVGSVNYPIELTSFRNYSPGIPTFVEDNFNHFHFKIDEDSDLFISRKHLGYLAILTPFSYFFTFFALIGLLMTGYHLLKRGVKSMVLDLRVKLQLSLTGMLILTMLVIGMVQIIYIININQKKNHDYLREKAYSIKTEVQHKYGADNSVPELISREPANFLIKLSNVFFTDINFYDPQGFLIASSRDKIFQEGLISDRIHPVAYQKMIVEHNSLLIHEEEIGTMKFASGYLPMYNDQGTLLGYINLPYFARQDELKREISSFLVTFVNIYIVLILFGAMLSILISNYITSPLALLSGKMSRLRLGKANEKISWKNNDEIGRLVADYNRMIDELEHSAIQMAKTERESAWREMARQVAHEIKNPLTPMKLSAQYLQRAWNDQAPDMDQRITRFTRTLVGQIDTLAAIASDFSDFARMPQPIPETLNFAEVIANVLSCYPESSTIEYVFEQEQEQYIIQADRSQMTRVLTNLINNAVHAIGSGTDGKICISLKQGAQCTILEVSDNGSGIPADRADRIFQPDFTTKSGGMGLGLAIVKGIIMEMGGEISFKSKELSGTTFTIKLPDRYKNSKTE